MKTLQLLALPLVLLCASLGAPAFAGVVPSKLSPQPRLCDNKAQCRPITMPAAAGVVTHIIGGDFVPGKTSWIAYGDKLPSLCYENPPAKGVRIRTVCVPILTDALYKEFMPRSLGGGSLLIVPMPGQRIADARAVNGFMIALGRAEDSLARHAGKPASVNASAGCGYEDNDTFATCIATDTDRGRSISYPGALASLNDGDDGMEFAATGGTCSFVPPNTWQCSGTRGVSTIPNGIPGPYEPDTIGPRGGAGTSGAGMSDVEKCQKMGLHCGVIRADTPREDDPNVERRKDFCINWLMAELDYYRMRHSVGSLTDEAYADWQKKIEEEYDMCMKRAVNPSFGF